VQKNIIFFPNFRHDIVIIDKPTLVCDLCDIKFAVILCIFLSVRLQNLDDGVTDRGEISLDDTYRSQTQCLPLWGHPKGPKIPNCDRKYLENDK